MASMGDAKRVVVSSGSEPERPETEGKVESVRKQWLVYEDGAIASRMQDVEINEHYKLNRQNRQTVRGDIPVAREVQTEEELQAQRERLKQLELSARNAVRDEQIAQSLQHQLLVREKEQEKLTQMTDQAIAQVIQECDRYYPSRQGDDRPHHGNDRDQHLRGDDRRGDLDERMGQGAFTAPDRGRQGSGYRDHNGQDRHQRDLESRTHGNSDHGNRTYGGSGARGGSDYVNQSRDGRMQWSSEEDSPYVNSSRSRVEDFESRSPPDRRAPSLPDRGRPADRQPQLSPDRVPGEGYSDKELTDEELARQLQAKEKELARDARKRHELRQRRKDLQQLSESLSKRGSDGRPEGRQQVRSRGGAGGADEEADFSDLYQAPDPRLTEEESRQAQERQDEEFARLLQEQEHKRKGGLAGREDHLREMETADAELARVMQEEEKLRLRKRELKRRQKVLEQKKEHHFQESQKHLANRGLPHHDNRAAISNERMQPYPGAQHDNQRQPANRGPPLPDSQRPANRGPPLPDSQRPTNRGPPLPDNQRLSTNRGLPSDYQMQPANRGPSQCDGHQRMLSHPGGNLDSNTPSIPPRPPQSAIDIVTESVDTGYGSERQMTGSSGSQGDSGDRPMVRRLSESSRRPQPTSESAHRPQPSQESSRSHGISNGFQPSGGSAYTVEWALRAGYDPNQPYRSKTCVSSDNTSHQPFQRDPSFGQSAQQPLARQPSSGQPPRQPPSNLPPWQRSEQPPRQQSLDQPPRQQSLDQHPRQQSLDQPPRQQSTEQAPWQHSPERPPPQQPAGARTTIMVTADDGSTVSVPAREQKANSRPANWRYSHPNFPSQSAQPPQNSHSSTATQPSHLQGGFADNPRGANGNAPFMGSRRLLNVNGTGTERQLVHSHTDPAFPPSSGGIPASARPHQPHLGNAGRHRDPADAEVAEHFRDVTEEYEDEWRSRHAPGHAQQSGALGNSSQSAFQRARPRSLERPLQRRVDDEPIYRQPFPVGDPRRNPAPVKTPQEEPIYDPPWTSPEDRFRQLQNAFGTPESCPMPSSGPVLNSCPTVMPTNTGANRAEHGEMLLRQKYQLPGAGLEDNEDYAELEPHNREWVSPAQPQRQGKKNQSCRQQ